MNTIQRKNCFKYSRLWFIHSCSLRMVSSTEFVNGVHNSRIAVGFFHVYLWPQAAPEIVILGHHDFYGFMDMSWATRQKLDQPLGSDVGPVHLEQFNIDGENGTLKLYTSGKISIVSKSGAEENILIEKTELDHVESHYRLQSHFIHCLDTGATFQTSGEDNLITLRMVFGVYESASQHVPIPIHTQEER